jgi:DinB superfamily
VRASIAALTIAVAILPRVGAAQSAPVADAFRTDESHVAKNLIAAADEMPGDKYGYKPTPAQMSFGQVVVHLSQGNDYFCGALSGTKAPERSKVAPTDSKDVLVARLKETFDFCDKALANVNDSNLGEQLPFFGGRTITRAGMMIDAAADWADHYSQSAIYLRLNGLLPPTAQGKKPAA